jgi:alkaline phosphatase
MNKRLIFLITLSTFTVLSCFEKNKSKNAGSDKPNIILFLVDDMGWQDTSVSFWEKKTPYNEIYKTPNMERLASQGVKFTNVYATALCSPTRVSLMSGMNAARHRVTNWTLHKDVNQPMEDNHKILSFPKWNVNGITTTLPQQLEVYHGKDVFLTEALTLETKKALDISLNNQKPFFLYMSHYTIHVPLMSDKRFIQKYI